MRLSPLILGLRDAIVKLVTNFSAAMSKALGIACPNPRIQRVMGRRTSIFDEKYRVIAIEGNRLLIRGILTGDVLAIVNPEPETPLTLAEYPPGKLIALSDPSTTPLN
jgi:hypothetical protein